MPQTTVEQAMQLAMQQHRNGQFAVAEDIYRKVLAQNPNHPDALHLLGAIASDLGKPQAGAELIRRAIALNPAVADYHSNLGNALGRLGKSEEAIAAHRAAVRLKPGYPELHFNLANALIKNGVASEAMAEYREAIRLKPNWAPPHNNLGHALHLNGQMGEAFAECRLALQLDPNYAEAYFNLGLFLLLNRQFDESIASIRQALRFKPDFAEAHYNLGNSLHEIGRFDEAIAAYRAALQFKPAYPEAENNLGVVLRDNGQLDESNAAYLRSLGLCHDNPPVRWNLGLNYLLLGRFKEGWEEYEWRWLCEGFRSARPNFRQPMWDGRDLNGQTILLHSEQGFGDTIQFVRYAPLVAQRGGKIILSCQPELARLLKSNPDLGQIVSETEPLPEFDLHCPLQSLPRTFNTDLQSIPAMKSYLRVDPTIAESWRQRVASTQNGFRVGLVWAGRPTHKRDRQRSIPLSQFVPLASVSDLTFFSLQKGPASRQIGALPDRMKMIDFTPHLHDFAETAALISNLDLLIGADTSVIHLAAAMGKPVWLLLPYIPDWRWLLHRDDSPWYPTIRLFRQTSPADWPPVFASVTKALARMR